MLVIFRGPTFREIHTRFFLAFVPSSHLRLFYKYLSISFFLETPNILCMSG